MGYKHGQGTPAVPGLSAEQARRRNAELRRELADLMAEHAVLAPKVDQMRTEVSAARKKLTRQIRDLDVIRSQTANLEAMAAAITPAEPVHGGLTGLQAAADEAKGNRRPGRALTHGKRSMYERGCDCDPCLTWRRNKTEYEKAREESKRAAAKRAA